MMTQLAARAALAQFRADVLRGLSKEQKQLPAKYFYDAAGSQLFDQITELDEYYPTRAEMSILRSHAGEMAERCGPRCLLVEPGAGSLAKVRLLLEKLEDPAGYVPMDVSGEHLAAAADELAEDFPDLEMASMVADFTQPLRLPPLPARRRVVFFPGSTLGNFERGEADALLGRMAGWVGAGGGLLLGVDLKKDRTKLLPAYDDAEGVTAAFNLNVLERINNELRGNFDLSAFRHLARYNAAKSRIEMHLVSVKAQQVQIGDALFEFAQGETIHTESSHKYDVDELGPRAAACGWRLDQSWTDEGRQFAMLFMTARG